MGIIGCIFWIIGGIIYVLYKYGTEELGLKKEHGCVFAIAPLVAIFVLGIICLALITEFGEADAGIIANAAVLMICVIALIRKCQAEKIENDVHRLDRPVHELASILPDPSLERMSELAADIARKKKQKYYTLEREDAYAESFQKYNDNIDKEPPCAQFKELQAAWLIIKRMKENSVKISNNWDTYISAYGVHREYFVITNEFRTMQELDKRLKKRRKNR